VFLMNWFEWRRRCDGRKREHCELLEQTMDSFAAEFFFLFLAENPLLHGFFQVAAMESVVAADLSLLPFSVF